MDNYKNIKTKENYLSLLKSGMFWEFHPELTGDWDVDSKFINANSTPEDCDSVKESIKSYYA